MIGLKGSIQRMFFDKPGVVARIGRGTARRLGQLGAFVRRRAQTSMRYRKKPSLPGQPPSAHGQALLRHNIFFASDGRSSVVIGPVALNQLYMSVGGGAGGMVPKKGVVPRTLEYGGSVGVREMLVPRSKSKKRGGGEWVAIGWKKRIGERKVAAWEATAEEKRLGRKILIPRGGGHVVTLFAIPEAIQTRIRWARIAARPYMGPALAKEMDSPKTRGLWLECVKAA